MDDRRQDGTPAPVGSSRVGAAIMVSCLVLSGGLAGCWLADDSADDDIYFDDDSMDDDTSDDGPYGPGTLTNSPEYCNDPGYLYPGSSDVGVFAAAKLRPAGWPFRVNGIRYVLVGGTSGSVVCRPDLAHRVEIYVASSSSPPDDGEFVYEIEVPGSGGLSDRTINQHIYPEIDLLSGQSLFVAIQLMGEYPEVGCLSLCYDDPVSTGSNFWSHATAAPFAWETIDEDGVDADILIEADGTYY